MKEFWTDIRTEKGKYQVSSKGELEVWIDGLIENHQGYSVRDRY